MFVLNRAVLVLVSVYTVLTSKDVRIHRISENDSLSLEGCYSNEGTATHWKFSDSLLYHYSVLHNKKYKYSVKRLWNNSLIITNATLDNEGTYECFIGETLVITHQVEVQGMCYCEETNYLNIYLSVKVPSVHIIMYSNRSLLWYDRIIKRGFKPVLVIHLW